MANFIQYGDRRLDMGELTLDQAKQLMARHFPELTDPLIKTEKKGDDTIYTFTKKAGRKGNAPAGTPSPLALAFEQLAALAEKPIVPAGLLAVLTGGDDVDIDPESVDSLERGLDREITQVQRFSQALADLPALATGGRVL